METNGRLDNLRPDATLREIADAFIIDYIVGTLGDFAPFLGEQASRERGYVMGFATASLGNILLENPQALADAGFAGLHELHA